MPAHERLDAPPGVGRVLGELGLLPVEEAVRRAVVRDRLVLDACPREGLRDEAGPFELFMEVPALESGHNRSGLWTTMAFQAPGRGPVAVPLNFPTVAVAAYSIPFTWSV